MSPELRHAADELARADEHMQRARDRRMRAIRAVMEARAGAEPEIRSLHLETNDLQRAEDEFLVVSRSFVILWRRELEQEERARVAADKAKHEASRG